MKGIVHIGDKLSSGGTVHSGASGMKFVGQAVARQGDTVSCRSPGHGVNRIAEGDQCFMHLGRPLALHGHKCECGCTLIFSLPRAGRALG
uniref:PAAR domain-containing protein n=1 Tax=Pseudomonas fluorescens TaxID=294 RepID=UPI00130E21AF|nr:PAAR domain-containing protein [Pseudomonas fluorescens]